MSWKEGFSEALLRFVRTQPGGGNAVRMTGLNVLPDEDCELCGSHPAVIEVNWTADDNTPYCTEWHGSLDELFAKLDD